MSAVNLRRTPLFDRHLELRARMVGFGGFEMPVQYAGVLREHDAVRTRAGLFDLSHMGQFVLRGPGVGAWADELTVNHVATLPVGGARYNLFCNERGGVHDDVIFYHFSENEWLLVVNASNARKMWELLTAHRRDGIGLENRHGSWALIAVQGPRAAEILSVLVAAEDRDRIAQLRYYACTRATVAWMEMLVARTGYTGEDGFELFVPCDEAVPLWDALLEAGAAGGLEACGLGARDVLRLEAGMPLYGHEIDEDITPLQAGLAWAVKLDKPAFPGRDALLAQREKAAYPVVAGFVVEGRAPPPRQGYRVFLDGEDVGEVRSGAPAPSLGGRGIGTALVAPHAAGEGKQLDVEIRGTTWPAKVVKMPFYKRAKR